MSSVNDTAKPTHWRSLNELENTPEFREFVEREFAQPLENEPANSPGRRRFMQLMGASFALAGVACRYEQDKILPLSRRPEGMVPGEPQAYATSMDLSGWATGLIAKSYDGRPIKLEGNPQHPMSLGACSIYHQASVLNLYDPDRSDSVAQYAGGQRTASTWKAFDTFAAQHFSGLRGSRGQGLRILAEASSSPTLAEQRRRLLTTFPGAKWVEYEALSRDNERLGSQLAFGAPHRALYAFDRAAVVLSLDADPIAPSHPAGLANARALITGRIPDAGTMNRVYAIESRYTLIGAVGDHRLPLRAELIKAVVAALDADLSPKAGAPTELGPAQAMPRAAFLSDPKVAKFLQVLTKDLLANRGRSVIVAGPQQPPEVHALAHRLNVLLGNVGNTVTYVADRDPDRLAHNDAIKALAAEMNAGQVDTLLIVGGNPVYDAPADVGFEAALAKVKTSIHLSLYEDETSRRVTWHVPQAHYLESWGDATAYDGTVSIVQPLIAPLYGGRSAIELLATLLGEPKAKALDLVRRVHAGLDDRAWRRAVHDGVIGGSRPAPATPQLAPQKPVTFTPRELGGVELENGQLEIVFTESTVYDGRFANNGWLMELPETFTKYTWGNVALMSPRTAQKLGVTDGNDVKLLLGGREVVIQAMIGPGHADGSVAVSLGYGRTDAGRVAGSREHDVAAVGANTYLIRTTTNAGFGAGLQVTAVGDGPRLSTTQDFHAIDQTGREGEQRRLPVIVRQGTLTEFKAKPNFANELVHHPPLLDLWDPPVTYEGHKWGMSIDLNKCIGCNACVAACVAENNIPIVGKKNVSMQREMHWIRVDRYYKGTPEEPEVTFQPLTCQHCETAPCEQVCPVGATMHSNEGLNDMVYNRCIGTRYCSNNCPYKVRRFNFFNYHEDETGITPWTRTDDPKIKVKMMVYNPEVTVRTRGVMEKCTFCVQRIQRVKIKAKNARRVIEDGEILSACQQSCPTNAIVFGDLADGTAKVTKLQKLPRSYALLEELNTRPRTQYMARVKNPHPELV
jgi:molybdopterin-containing oxidoreductase family iron-sulfur binding subunit